MAFDIYVGPLTRYYLGAWENPAERSARERGVPYEVVRPGDCGGEAAQSDPEAVREAVRDWREALTELLGQQLESPLEWQDTAEGPYIAERPHWRGYGALLLLAAYEEHGEHDPPQSMPERWQDDPVLALSREEGLLDSDYGAILLPELWLPCDFAFMFNFVDLAGHEMFISSIGALREQLDALNARTFQGAPDDWEAWTREGPPEDESDFPANARYALGVFLRMASAAAIQGTPMKLDY